MPIFCFILHRQQKMALTQEQRRRDKQGAVPPCSSNSSTSCLTPISAGGPSVSPLSLVSTNQSSFQSESQQQQTKRPASVCSDASSYEEGDEFVTIYPYQLRKRRDSDEYSRLFQENVPSSVADRLIPFETRPIEEFEQAAGVPAPQYAHILENDYGDYENKLRRQGIDPIPHLRQHFGGGTGGDYVCTCASPSKEELAAGHLACEKDCINRCVHMECDSRCPAHSLCSNRRFQLRLYAPTEPFYCGPHKGWGLRATKDIAKGTFIVEYTGEVINFVEFQRRVRYYNKMKQPHHYFMSVAPDFIIDSGIKGNWSRFVNHSCEPNAETEKWIVNGLPRVGFFAARDIKVGEEVTIDYNFVQYGRTEQKCYCGTLSCTGVMGFTDKQFRDKVCLRDTRAVDRLINRLLEGEILKSTNDVTNLIQVLLQGYITRYSRKELLNVVIETQNADCLKAFRTYNGLEVLASYMCDTKTTDWEMKLKILQCIDRIPVTAQQQVQTNSDLMGYVKQWSIDPRYCKSRSSADELESKAITAERQQEEQQSDSQNGTEKPSKAEEDKLEGNFEDSKEFDPNSIKIYSPSAEQEVIENIRQLALQIHQRWSSLPLKIFRIPRVEHKLNGERPRSRSPPLSLVNQCVPSQSSNNDMYRLWRMSSESPKKSYSKRRRFDLRPKNNNSSGRNGLALKKCSSTPGQKPNIETPVTLSDANNSSSSSFKSENDPPYSSTIPQNLLDLLEEALTHVMKTLTVPDEDFLAVKATAKEQMLAIVKACYLKTGEETAEKYLNEVIKAAKENVGNDREEAEWKSATDPQSGKTYYYNTSTKETRWDPPTYHRASLSKNPIVKKLFETIYANSANTLKQFRRPNCLTGRLTSDEDLRYVARGFAEKYTKQLCARTADIGSIVLDEKLLQKINSKLVSYMLKHGPVYVRSHRNKFRAQQAVANGSRVVATTVTNLIHQQQSAEETSDMEIDED
nr:histone lysine N methyltransferase SETD2 [Hymenolepis microstoma]